MWVGLKQLHASLVHRYLNELRCSDGDSTPKLGVRVASKKPGIENLWTVVSHSQTSRLWQKVWKI